MPYIEDMKTRGTSAFDELHQDVNRIIFTDFPDHANVGDSAIALGQQAYWDSKSVEVAKTFSATVLPTEVFASHEPVFIHGGGNFGGLYPPLSEHRYRLAEALRPETLLIQGAQSVHFVDSHAYAEFKARMASRPSLRVAVRDLESFELLRPHVPNLILSPDAVHFLGPIASLEPTQKRVYLSRTDAESSVPAGQGSVDWGRDSIDLLVPWWFSLRCKQIPAMKPMFNRSNTWWMSKAEKRFLRGVEILSRGETVVTDRLHAMLIALQMGRKVVARDSNNKKLSRYAATWFGDSPPEGLSWER